MVLNALRLSSYMSHLSTITHRYNYLSVREKQFGHLQLRKSIIVFILPLVKQCETIPDKFTTTYFIAWANLQERIQELDEKQERAHKVLYEGIS